MREQRSLWYHRQKHYNTCGNRSPLSRKWEGQTLVPCADRCKSRTQTAICPALAWEWVRKWANYLAFPCFFESIRRIAQKKCQKNNYLKIIIAYASCSVCEFILEKQKIHLWIFTEAAGDQHRRSCLCIPRGGGQQTVDTCGFSLRLCCYRPNWTILSFDLRIKLAAASGKQIVVRGVCALILLLLWWGSNLIR